jgi:hypothetical protein
MAVVLSSVAHRIRAFIKTAPLGHVHEFLAAALGYKSFASYKTSPEEATSFRDAKHIVLDSALLQQRQANLGYAGPSLGPIIVDALENVFPTLRAHLSTSDLEDVIRLDVEVWIGDSGTFSSAQAETNTDGPPELELEFEAQIPLNIPAREELPYPKDGGSAIRCHTWSFGHRESNHDLSKGRSVLKRVKGSAHTNSRTQDRLRLA